MKKRVFAIILAFMLVCILLPATASAAVVTDVANWDQFKAAVENSTTTYIRLTANIEFPKKSATINTAKPELVIDGNGFTLTDAAASSRSYTLQYNKVGNLKDITVTNINIVGRNCYGMITISDSSKFNDVTVTFDNITYTGPGLSWGEKSKYVIRDSDITLTPSKESSAHEIIECLHLRLEGNVNLVKSAPKSIYEMFKINGSNGGVTIASGANVIAKNNDPGDKVKSTGFVHYACSNIYFVFEDDSSFVYTGNNLFQQGSSIDRLYVGKRAYVEITLYGDLYCCYGAFHTRGDMTVDQGATFRVLALNNRQTQPVVQLRGKGSCTFINPREVFIFNSSTNKCNTGLAIGPEGCTVNFIFNDINSLEFWKFNTAPHTNLPLATYHWRNVGGSLFSAKINICGSICKAASTVGYTGVVPFNTTTAAVKDINVVRINGGIAPPPAQDTVDIIGTVAWNDIDNQYNTRPAFVSVDLYRDGELLQTIQVSSGDNGSFVFPGLDKYALDGSEYLYTIGEQSIVLYQINIIGYNITNTLITP